MQTYIIYIPGLGDQYGRFRTWALKTWRLWGVTVVHQAITWYDGGDMESKLMLIEAAVNQAPEGARVVLVGESAGAALALHAAMRNQRISRVITLCGVARPDTPISTFLRRKAPALHQASSSLPERFTVDVHSIRAKVDGVVGKRYSSTVDATRHVVWSVGHLTTIVLCLTIYAPILASIAKNAKK